MKRLFALLVAAIFALPALGQTVIRPGGSIYDQSSGSFVGFLNLNNGREERLTATLGSGLTATSVVCVDASKAFTSTCSSATPSFGATAVTTLTASGRVSAGTNGILLSANTGISAHTADTGALDHISSHTRIFSDGVDTLTPGDIQFYTTSSDGSAGGLAFTVTNTGVQAAVSTISPLFRSTAAKVLLQGTGTGATQVAATQTTPPTCTTNCGTSPSIAGTDTAGVVSMGASGVPASGWVVTFNATWAAAPSCVVQSALTTMVVGKQPIAVQTSTTTMTVTTNGTAPSTSDKYAFVCFGVS